MHNIILNNNCLPGPHTDPPPGLPDSAAGRRQLQGAQERLQVPAEVIHPPSPPPSPPSNRATQVILQQILLDRLPPAVNQLSFCQNFPQPWGCPPPPPFPIPSLIGSYANHQIVTSSAILHPDAPILNSMISSSY
jgi:hypothetical protein